MSLLKKINVKASRVVTNKGKLINRKSFIRLIKPYKMSFSKKKERVKELNNVINKIKELTLKDKDGLEYASSVSKYGSIYNTPILKGQILPNGVKVVDIPKVNQNKNWLIHSHPDNVPLSLPDLKATKKGGTLFAVTPDNSIYRATNKKNTKEIVNEYNKLAEKIRESKIIKEINDILTYNNPNVNKENIRNDAFLAVQHKILSKLHEKGFIHYRAKLSPGSKRVINRYSELDKLELKRYYLGDICFSKKSKYYIPKNKWYKIPKKIRNEIRRREEKYKNNYNLAVKKDKRLKQLYAKIGVK